MSVYSSCLSSSPQQSPLTSLYLFLPFFPTHSHSLQPQWIFLKMVGTYDNCTEVTDFCVVEATTYGYYPNLGANAFFLAIFALCMGIQFFQGVRWRSWSYMIAMTVGCLGEVLGQLYPFI